MILLLFIIISIHTIVSTITIITIVIVIIIQVSLPLYEVVSVAVPLSESRFHKSKFL